MRLGVGMCDMAVGCVCGVNPHVGKNPTVSVRKRTPDTNRPNDPLDLTQIHMIGRMPNGSVGPVRGPKLQGVPLGQLPAAGRRGPDPRPVRQQQRLYLPGRPPCLWGTGGVHTEFVNEEQPKKKPPPTPTRRPSRGDSRRRKRLPAGQDGGPLN